jgi:hypothetical protein
MESSAAVVQDLTFLPGKSQHGGPIGVGGRPIAAFDAVGGHLVVHKVLVGTGSTANREAQP